jgi:anthranilate phosphoribosyltransferase
MSLQPPALAQLRSFLEQLLAGRDLTAADAGQLLQGLTEAELPAPLAGALLVALRAKGVCAAELRGLATAMRALARRPALPAGLPAVDIVGTGGDASGSYNLSTGAALLTAACGVPVVKHGNRSVSSRSGSADVLEQLGLKLPLDEQAAAACLTATQFTFLFAPHYHPAMKAIAPVRAALGVRTVFNILGPLTNPAAPPYQVIGAYDAGVAKLMAETFSGLPIERAFVIHSENGWDEPTPVAPFRIFDVRPGSIRELTRSAADYGLPLCSASELAGGDAAYNATGLRAVLTGADRGAHRDALLLGCALALEVAGSAKNPREAVALAANGLDSGAAAQLLSKLAEFGRGQYT